MSSVYFDFYFRDSDVNSRSGTAWIVPKDYYTESVVGDDRIVTLSEDCSNVPQLETVIKRMHADLDDILKRAKSKFSDTRHHLASQAEEQQPDACAP